MVNTFLNEYVQKHILHMSEDDIKIIDQRYKTRLIQKDRR